MEHSIEHRPSYALLTVDLKRGEQLVAEAGSMVRHGGDVDIETGARGGVLDSLKRTAFGGESFFMNTYTATADTAVSLAPALPGDLIAEALDGRLLVQSGSFVAAPATVDVDTTFGGGRTFFGGEGLFLLDIEGHGDLFLSSYGAIDRVDVPAGESVVVDTGHVVAFDPDVEWSVTRVGGLKSTLFSGEGLVCEFTGPGTVWTQSRSADALLAWLAPRLPGGGDGGGGRGGGFSVNF
ncbi:MAG: TIGR00266 family protein [Haloarculaceae archaeon]